MIDNRNKNIICIYPAKRILQKMQTDKFIKPKTKIIIDSSADLSVNKLAFDLKKVIGENHA